MESNEKEFVFKVLLVGDPGISFKILLLQLLGVGKSSILSNYVKRDFKTDHNATIGVEFGSKNIQLDEETRIKLQIWDTVLFYY